MGTKRSSAFSRPCPSAVGKFLLAKEEFYHVLKMGSVRPSSGPWASAIYTVPKPSGDWRPCGDYKPINRVTVPDVPDYPMQDVIPAFSVYGVFGRIGLVQVYSQIP